jgi:hypothetical protein
VITHLDNASTFVEQGAKGGYSVVDLTRELAKAARDAFPGSAMQWSDFRAGPGSW